ncbi:protein kinase [Plantactinospora siamensis]|uniref:non-specific serine/threonine protein kinase n=1 Tax=Plantactinospora siamensis TaxID=555372 RepID=A0ABV6NWJ8_9ACTN
MTRLLGERYRLVERLGAGGMSMVWRGYDEVLGRQVAVKVLAPKLAADRAFRHRIRLEAKAAARLCHPHITNVYDYGESTTAGATVPYVVMELLDGESLASRLARGGSLPWRAALTVCAEVATALAAAHARGVVHRDITPGNVMLTPTGAKVVDFGISALVGEQDVGPDGAVLGTPAYLAPERLDGGQVTAATDVYSLGLLVYRSLTGRLPWAASSKTDLIRAHLYREPGPMPDVPGLPEGIAELCERCLAKAPGERPSIVEVARELSAALGIAAVLPVSPAPTALPGVYEYTPDELANAGTTILPSSAATDVFRLPSGAAARRRGQVRRAGQRSRRRPLEAAAVGVGLVAVTGVVWALTSGSPAHGPEAAAAAEPQAAPPCEVIYRLRSDTGSGFDADVRVTNTRGEVVPDWQLSFAFPGDQTVTEGRSAMVEQQGSSVLLRSQPGAAPLGAGASAAVEVSGKYRAGNPLPTQFQLNDASCAVQVSGVAGQPISVPAGGQAAGGGAPGGADRATGGTGSARGPAASAGRPKPAKAAKKAAPHKSAPQGKAKGKDTGKKA